MIPTRKAPHLTRKLVTTTAKGTLTLNSNGAFTYVPHLNANGADSFTYKVFDGVNRSAPVTVNLSIAAVNDPPTAQPDSYNAVQGITLSVSAPGVLANDSDLDGDTVTAVLLAGPTHGALALNTDGSFSYTSDAGFTGTDQFTYRARDGSLASADTVVNISVTATTTERTMRVASIVVSTKDMGKGLKKGYAEVVVVDQAGAPVSGASVTGAFSEDIQETVTGSTGPDGKATLPTTQTGSGRCRLTFCVSQVAVTGASYSAGDNAETCDKNY
jgi:hypothetical protein